MPENGSSFPEHSADNGTTGMTAQTTRPRQQDDRRGNRLAGSEETASSISSVIRAGAVLPIL